jgi:histidinol dehydrogenase
VAPEHLEVMTADAAGVAKRCQHYGGLFVGAVAAEVLGDYGCGPNHVLPTGGTARFSGGLSVFNFLRVRTWMRIDDARASQQVATGPQGTATRQQVTRLSFSRLPFFCRFSFSQPLARW